jgi:four helix bundle protein
MPGKGFVELIVWRESAELAAAVVRLSPCFGGPGARNVVDQIVRAAESIPANIAEGYGRGVSKDCARFLKIARASATELESHLRVASLAGRVRDTDIAPLLGRLARVRYLIGRFLASVESRCS